MAIDRRVPRASPLCHPPHSFPLSPRASPPSLPSPLQTRHVAGSPFLSYVAPGDLWADGARIFPGANESASAAGSASASAPASPASLLGAAGVSFSRGAFASGRGLAAATAGRPARFLIHGRDAHGNARGGAGAEDAYLVQLEMVRERERWGAKRAP
jgi:hypothetical protein